MSGTVTPSPAAGFSTLAFSDAEKADVRRFCGYPIYGGEGQTGFVGWRFFQAYGLLEFRMNNLAPAEYSNARYYLSTLYTLESAVFGAGANLTADVAGPYVHNKQEVSDRMQLYTMWRRQLADLMGVPPGPNLTRGGRAVVV